MLSHTLRHKPLPPSATRFAVLLLFFAVSLFAVAGGVQEEDPSVGTSQLVPLDILVPNSVSAIPVLALADDFAGSYSVSFFTDHPQAMARLLSGEVDILMTGYSVGLRRYVSEGDLVHLATPVWGASAVMTAREVGTWQELAGGIVYVPFEGSPIDLYVQRVLETEGLADQVEVRYAPFPQSSALLAEGDADAAVLVEPIASRLEAAGSAYRLENLHEGWSRISGGEERSPQVSLFVTDEVAGAYQNALTTFVERLDESIGDVLIDPAGFAERYAPVLNFPEPIVEQALRNTLFALPDSQESRAIIAQYAEIIGQTPPEMDFYFGE